MLRCPLEKLVLNVKALNEEISLLSNALEPPDLSGIINAIDNLRDAGALTTEEGDLSDILNSSKIDCSGKLTYIGKLFVSLPLHFRVCKMVFLCYIFGYLEEGLIMAASMSLQSAFVRGFRPSLDAFKAKLDFANDTSSDSLASLFLYREWRYERAVNQWSHRDEMTWCRRRFVVLKVLREIHDLVVQLAKRLESHRIRVEDSLLISTEEDQEIFDEESTPAPASWFKEIPKSVSTSNKSGGKSVLQKKLGKDDINLLSMILFGAFYPNYLFTQHDDPDGWSYAVNNSDIMDYEPKRTIELRK